MRLAEAFRLAEQLRDSVWPGWSEVPFAVLLVTEDYEFLLRHPRPSDDFRPLGQEGKLGTDVLFRPRTFPPNLLAAFPAVGGISTVVVGQPHATDRHSTAWVLTLLHEHFHQWQNAWPGYFAAVDSLELSDGDQTGMWMLNYPFPYDSAEVQDRFTTLATALGTALDATSSDDFEPRFADFLAAQRAFRESLSPRDYRYFAFQVWQEGVARYTEYRLARLAARHYAPTEAFRELTDYLPFEQVGASLLDNIRGILQEPALVRHRRVSFYAVGAAMTLLLDAARPGWQTHYFAEPFRLDHMLDKNHLHSFPKADNAQTVRTDHGANEGAIWPAPPR